MSDRYKYCIVPLCTSTTKSTPDKQFFDVPRKTAIRKRWCLAMRRDPSLSTSTSRHVCEDHFNLETDVRNYMRYRLQGVKRLLKPDVLPHIFACQKPKKEQKTEGRRRQTYENRMRRLLVADLLKASEQPSIPTCVSTYSSNKKISKQHLKHHNFNVQVQRKFEDKAVQVQIKEEVQSKSTNTSQAETKDAANSSIKLEPAVFDSLKETASSKSTNTSLGGTKNASNYPIKLEPAVFDSSAEFLPSLGEIYSLKEKIPSKSTNTSLARSTDASDSSIKLEPRIFDSSDDFISSLGENEEEYKMNDKNFFNIRVKNNMIKAIKQEPLFD